MKNRKPIVLVREVIGFFAALLIFFTLLFLIFLRHFKQIKYWHVLLIALFLYLIYLFYRLIKAQEAKGFLKGIKDFGHIITNIINFILLFVVYFIGVGITAIIAKLAKKHFLDMKTKKDSYWVKLNLGKKKFKNYYRQF